MIKMTYEERTKLIEEYLGKTVRIVIDRPAGYVHKKDKYTLVYPINYGFIPGVPRGSGRLSAGRPGTRGGVRGEDHRRRAAGGRRGGQAHRRAGGSLLHGGRDGGGGGIPGKILPINGGAVLRKIKNTYAEKGANQ